MNHKAKAIELLGEKKPNEIIAKGFYKAAQQDTTKDTIREMWIAEGIRQGVTTMHSKAVEVVEGLLEESTNQRLNDKESIASLTKSCKEAIKQLQSLKDKLAGEDLVNIIHKSELCKAANKDADWVTRRIRKRDLAKAIKELEK